MDYNTFRKIPPPPIITMPQDPNNLIWIDMEMSGLNPDTDKVLEIAIVVTDSALNTVAEAPVLVVRQPDAVLDGMDDWNRSTHAKSGLVERVKASILAEAAVQQTLVAFLSQHVPPRISPMCGNTVHQDRRFMARHLPDLEAYLSERPYANDADMLRTRLPELREAIRRLN